MPFQIPTDRQTLAANLSAAAESRKICGIPKIKQAFSMVTCPLCITLEVQRGKNRSGLKNASGLHPTSETPDVRIPVGTFPATLCPAPLRQKIS